MEKIGKYQILEKVGQGGMGVVYKALDPLIERVVAVKTLPADVDDDPEWRARFFREGRSAGQLSHKNIVTIFDLGEEAGMAYMAMEFLEGEDLRKKILNNAPLTLEDKIRIMKDVCEGLAHAHEKNVIHRDIKPANVFVTRTGQAKILDFGLARPEVSDLTTSGHTVGTPNYMSPEQVRGDKVDHRTDIFSVGALFYELLTYHKAFRGDSFASTIFKILQDEPESIRHFDSRISPNLAAIVSKALVKDRDQRYQSLLEMLDDLNGYRELFCALPSSTPGPIPPERLERRPPSKREDEATTKGMSPAGSKNAGGRNAEAASSWSREPAGKAAGSGAAAGGDEDASQAAASLETSVSLSVLPRRFVATALFVTAILAGSGWLLVHLRNSRAPGTRDDQAPLSPLVQPAPPPTVAPPPPVSVPSVNETPQLPPVQEGHTAGDLTKAAIALKAHKFSEAEQEAGRVLKDSPGNAEARSILEKARLSLDTVEREISKAKSYLDSGDYRQARAALAEVLKVAPSDEAGIRLLNQVNRVTRQHADQALARQKDARTGAEGVRASEFAPQSFAAARIAEEEAVRLYAAGSFEEAAAKLTDAGELYRRAEKEARSESAVRSDSTRKSEMERQLAQLRNKNDVARQVYEHERDLAVQAGSANRARDQFAEAERTANSAKALGESGDFDRATHEYEAAAAAMQRARSVAIETMRRETPVPAELPREAPRATPPASRNNTEDVQKEVLSLPERYKSAMEGKDLSLLKSIWPSLGAQQEQAFKNQWTYTRSLRIDLKNRKIEKLEGNTALLSVLLHNEQVIDNGTSKRWDQKATFSLSKSGGSWVIESANFEMVR